jgi:hypothetical protein
MCVLFVMFVANEKRKRKREDKAGEVSRAQTCKREKKEETRSLASADRSGTRTPARRRAGNT